MDINQRRRDIVKLAALFAAGAALQGVFPKTLLAQSMAASAPSSIGSVIDDPQNGYAIDHSSNYKAVYQDPQLKAAFFLFLKNVYNLYPENQFHALIADVTEAASSDKEIYRLAQFRIGMIKPFLSEVRYALPALQQQKKEMAHETLELLKDARKINGYMEIGTTGRYLSKFQSSIALTGDVIMLNADAPGYAPIDIAERGQISKLGRYVPLKDYSPITSTEVADQSLDLVINYIGFHHSEPAKLAAFVTSIHRVLRPGGRMIVRDHDVNSPQMNRIVALAHDVFNMGLGADWAVNQKEIRNFTSIPQLVAYLENLGFKSTRRALLQPGDPTHNALMEFVRT